MKTVAAGSVNIYLGAKAGRPLQMLLLQFLLPVSHTAIEGTDFTLSSKTVSVGVGETAITVTPINNDVFQGNKKFNLIIASNSKGYPIADQDTLTVTLVDDEHPLKAWIGTYTVAAASYGNPVHGMKNGLLQLPRCRQLDHYKWLVLEVGSTIPVIGTVNKTAMTITFNPGNR